MSLLGDNKLVHALESVNQMGPHLLDLVEEMRQMRETLAATNAELRGVKAELEVVKSSMTNAASEVAGAAGSLRDLAVTNGSG